MTIKQHIRWKPINSSAIKAIAYENDTLYVRFMNDRVYQYENVGRELYAKLVTADSIGKFFNCNVKPNFKYQEI